MDCLFCKIIDGSIPAYKIYEDDVVLAFLDINPDTPGHTLIIPKKHYQDITDIDTITLTHIMDIAKLLKTRMEERLHINGLTLVQNNGSVQEVKHFHLHLKPFYLKKEEKTLEEVYEILT